MKSCDFLGQYGLVMSMRLLHPWYSSKVPWLLHRNESIVPSHIGLENHNFSGSLSTECNYRRVKFSYVQNTVLYVENYLKYLSLVEWFILAIAVLYVILIAICKMYNCIQASFKWASFIWFCFQHWRERFLSQF